MVKKKRKTGVSRKKLKTSSRKVVLTEALSDISRELSLLNKEKSKLIGRIQTVESKILSTQNKEKDLRDKITRLISEESDLANKKANSESQIERVKEKISKIKKIKEELGEV